MKPLTAIAILCLACTALNAWMIGRAQLHLEAAQIERKLSREHLETTLEVQRAAIASNRQIMARWGYER